jgi:hypothetical protein
VGGKKNQPEREVDVDDDSSCHRRRQPLPFCPPPVPLPVAQQATATPTEAPTPADAAPVAQTRGANAQLDLAFCCDCTGSMGAYIRSAQDNILAIAQQIHAAKSQQCSLRFSLVKYRDHLPQASTFVTEVYPFHAVPRRDEKQRRHDGGSR